MIHSVIPDDVITLDMLAKINYEMLESKYNIHKYYPKYIHNSAISTPVLRDLIVDKPIYKDANKHVKRNKEFRRQLLKQKYQKKIKNVETGDLADMSFSKERPSHIEDVDTLCNENDAMLIGRESIRSQRRQLRKQQHEERKQMRQDHTQQRKQMRRGTDEFDFGDPYKKLTSRQTQCVPKTPMGTKSRDVDDIQFRNPFDEFDNNLVKLSNLSIVSRERRSSSMVSKRNNSIASKFFNFMRQSQDELRETPPSSSHSPENAQDKADVNDGSMQRSNSFDQTKSTNTSKRWNMFKKITDRRGSYMKIGTYNFFFLFEE
jgi:hypothetical protein